MQWSNVAIFDDPGNKIIRGDTSESSEIDNEDRDSIFIFVSSFRSMFPKFFRVDAFTVPAYCSKLRSIMRQKKRRRWCSVDFYFKDNYSAVFICSFRFPKCSMRLVIPL